MRRRPSPTTDKMEFPKYDGTGDLLPWLNRCERYFRIRHTLEHQRVAYASFYLTDDAQLWYHRLEVNVHPPPWPCFVSMVNKHFWPPLTESPIGELALLHREGPVDHGSTPSSTLHREPRQPLAYRCHTPAPCYPRRHGHASPCL
jgi:hypothetical protein